MSSYNKPTGDTNELAKERNRLAAERTLTSWIQNCLILITFGIGFERIFYALSQSSLNKYLLINIQLTRLIGLSTIAIGIFLLGLAVIQFLMQVNSLKQTDYLYKPFRFINHTIIVGSVILFGVVAFFAVFVISTQSK
jgi:putative membrane protein